MTYISITRNTVGYWALTSAMMVFTEVPKILRGRDTQNVQNVEGQQIEQESDPDVISES